MRIRIRFRGPLASRLSTETIELEVDNNSNLHQVLEKLLLAIPDIKETWDSPEQIDRDTLLLKNETDVGLLQGLHTLLQKDDEIVILPLVHGG